MGQVIEESQPDGHRSAISPVVREQYDLAATAISEDRGGDFMAGVYAALGWVLAETRTPPIPTTPTVEDPQAKEGELDDE